MKPADRPGTMARRPHLPTWRREALRTTLWLVPAVLVVVVAVLFAITYGLDRAVYRGDLSLPGWLHRDSADAGRQVLTAIAAAVITVVGVVFSITILALTLASQQFGPRMLRTFIRDFGNQFTLGAFVATFVYAVLALGSIGNGSHGEFVPSISISVALALTLGDLVVLIYFIHHIAVSIQLPEVIAGIARDLNQAIDAEFEVAASAAGPPDLADPPGRSVGELVEILERGGVTVPATTSGYLQFVGYGQLVRIAQDNEAVIRLAHRPGHFVVAGAPLATVWPAPAAPRVATALARAHVTGPHRTLLQDPVFAIDQLVEIAIRALSPAVNDTFTALTCIDWLSDGLRRLSQRSLERGAYRDRQGQIRLIEASLDYERVVSRAYAKIRQAGRGMPAVAIRLLDALTRVMNETTSAAQRAVLVKQAEMVLRSSEEAIPEPDDRADVRRAYERLVVVTTVKDAAG